MISEILTEALTIIPSNQDDESSLCTANSNIENLGALRHIIDYNYNLIFIINEHIYVKITRLNTIKDIK